MSFNLDEYVDVAQRISEFYAKYPQGSLKTGSLPQFVETGGKAFVVYHAQAFRDPEDALPADGWAWEPVPGPTQFTRDSELQNAETAAWGRAIVALGFETKKIASAEEVRNRSVAGGVQTTGGQETSASQPSSPAAEAAERAQAAYDASRVVPDDDGDPKNVEVHFGKNKGTPLAALTDKQRSWYANTWDPDADPRYPAKPEDRRLKLAAQILVAGGGEVDFQRAIAEDEIPF